MGNDVSKAAGPGQPNMTDLTVEERDKEISRMDSQVRGRVRKSVKYNMKIVIRGDRGTGKTMLWRRFQGLNFLPTHEETPEIQSAYINWDFNKSEESAKVEIWDVVDRGSGGELEIPGTFSTAAQSKSIPVTGSHRLGRFDAQAVDVYKNAHAALFLINPHDRGTLDYVWNQCKAVPDDVAILIVLNFRDTTDNDEDQNENEEVRKSRESAVGGHSSNKGTNSISSSSSNKNESGGENYDGRNNNNNNNNNEDNNRNNDDNGIDESGKNAPSRESVFQIVTLNEIQKLANKIIRRRNRSKMKKLKCTEKKNAKNGAVDEGSNQSTRKDGNSSSEHSADESDSAEHSSEHSLGCSAGVHCLVTSMINCYGLKNLHEYLQIPFLRVKKAFFTNQLLQTERDLDRLDCSLMTQLLPSDKNSYSNFVAAYETRVRGAGPSSSEGTDGEDTNTNSNSSTNHRDSHTNSSSSSNGAVATEETTYREESGGRERERERDVDDEDMSVGRSSNRSGNSIGRGTEKERGNDGTTSKRAPLVVNRRGSVGRFGGRSSEDEDTEEERERRRNHNNSSSDEENTQVRGFKRRQSPPFKTKQEEKVPHSELVQPRGNENKREKEREEREKEREPDSMEGFNPTGGAKLGGGFLDDDSDDSLSRPVKAGGSQMNGNGNGNASLSGKSGSRGLKKEVVKGKGRGADRDGQGSVVRSGLSGDSSQESNSEREGEGARGTWNGKVQNPSTKDGTKKGNSDDRNGTQEGDMGVSHSAVNGAVTSKGIKRNEAEQGREEAVLESSDKVERRGGLKKIGKKKPIQLQLPLSQAQIQTPVQTNDVHTIPEVMMSEYADPQFGNALSSTSSTTATAASTALPQSLPLDPQHAVTHAATLPTNINIVTHALSTDYSDAMSATDSTAVEECSADELRGKTLNIDENEEKEESGDDSVAVSSSGVSDTNEDKRLDYHSNGDKDEYRHGAEECAGGVNVNGRAKHDLTSEMSLTSFTAKMSQEEEKVEKAKRVREGMGEEGREGEKVGGAMENEVEEGENAVQGIGGGERERDGIGRSRGLVRIAKKKKDVQPLQDDARIDAVRDSHALSSTTGEAASNGPVVEGDNSDAVRTGDEDAERGATTTLRLSPPLYRPPSAAIITDVSSKDSHLFSTRVTDATNVDAVGVLNDGVAIDAPYDISGVLNDVSGLRLIGEKVQCTDNKDHYEEVNDFVSVFIEEEREVKNILSSDLDATPAGTGADEMEEIGGGEDYLSEKRHIEHVTKHSVTGETVELEITKSGNMEDVERNDHLIKGIEVVEEGDKIEDVQCDTAEGLNERRENEEKDGGGESEGAGSLSDKTYSSSADLEEIPTGMNSSDQLDPSSHEDDGRQGTAYVPHVPTATLTGRGERNEGERVGIAGAHGGNAEDGDGVFGVVDRCHISDTQSSPIKEDHSPLTHVTVELKEEEKEERYVLSKDESEGDYESRCTVQHVRYNSLQTESAHCSNQLQHFSAPDCHDDHEERDFFQDVDEEGVVEVDECDGVAAGVAGSDGDGDMNTIRDVNREKEDMGGQEKEAAFEEMLDKAGAVGSSKYSTDMTISVDVINVHTVPVALKQDDTVPINEAFAMQQTSLHVALPNKSIAEEGGLERLGGGGGGGRGGSGMTTATLTAAPAASSASSSDIDTSHIASTSSLVSPSENSATTHIFPIPSLVPVTVPPSSTPTASARALPTPVPVPVPVPVPLARETRRRIIDAPTDDDPSDNMGHPRPHSVGYYSNSNNGSSSSSGYAAKVLENSVPTATGSAVSSAVKSAIQQALLDASLWGKEGEGGTEGRGEEEVADERRRRKERKREKKAEEERQRRSMYGTEDGCGDGDEGGDGHDTSVKKRKDKKSQEGKIGKKEKKDKDRDKDKHRDEGLGSDVKEKKKKKKSKQSAQSDVEREGGEGEGEGGSGGYYGLEEDLDF